MALVFSVMLEKLASNVVAVMLNNAHYAKKINNYFKANVLVILQSKLKKNSSLSKI
jgi:hypothetical protein